MQMASLGYLPNFPWHRLDSLNQTECQKGFLTIQPMMSSSSAVWTHQRNVVLRPCALRPHRY